MATASNLRWRPILVIDGETFLDDRAPALAIDELPECCQRLINKRGLLNFECLDCGSAFIVDVLIRTGARTR